MPQNDSNVPAQWGLTGNIGSGKSTVARFFAEKGAAIIDADALAQAATEDAAVLARIAEALGTQLVVDGVLDRQATAARIFADDTARQTLNSIIHPWVAHAREAELEALLQQDHPPRVIIHDIPLLYETGLDAVIPKVMVVAAPFALRQQRVLARSGLSAEAFTRRDAAQIPLEEKVSRADIVIDNSASLEDLGMQLETVWRDIQPY